MEGFFSAPVRTEPPPPGSAVVDREWVPSPMQVESARLLLSLVWVFEDALVSGTTLRAERVRVTSMGQRCMINACVSLRFTGDVSCCPSD
jgi:hypothetical protein